MYFFSRSERKQWAFGLFLGCTVLYSCRTVTPLCVAVMAKEFDWDKTQSVRNFFSLIFKLDGIAQIHIHKQKNHHVDIP